MQALSDPRFSLRDLYRILFRYKIRSAMVFVATIALVFVGLVVAPREYASEARLFIKTGRESVALDPTATTGQTLQFLDSRENEISSLWQSSARYEPSISESERANLYAGWLDAIRRSSTTI